MTSIYCAPHAPFLQVVSALTGKAILIANSGFAGCASAIIFSVIGSAYGTAKAGIGISGIGITRPDLIMKVRFSESILSLIPVVMAGIIAVYGLVVSVLIVGAMDPGKPYSLFQGYIHLAAGLSCGGTGLVAGHAIGTIGDAGVRMFSLSNRVFVSMVLMLIFAEVIGLYGLIVALILNTSAGEAKCF